MMKNNKKGKHPMHLNLVFLVVLLQDTHSTARRLEEHRRIVE